MNELESNLFCDAPSGEKMVFSGLKIQIIEVFGCQLVKTAASCVDIGERQRAMRAVC